MSAAGAEVSAQAPQGAASWELQWHNDGFANSDNQFTNGVSLRKHSELFGSLEATRGTPAFGKALARWFLPESSSLHYRETWAVGQNMQTPDEIAREEIILSDVPYVGMLGWTNNYTAFDDNRFSGFGFLLGWVGDSALGEEAQELAHDITGARDPQGWDNQLDFEPLVNLYYASKRKLLSTSGFDVAAALDLAAGNFFTYGRGALEFRFGDRPRGFTPVPMPTGHGLDYMPVHLESGRVYTYLTAVVRATAFAHVMPRDGNLFRDGDEWTENNTLNPEELVGQLVLAVHHERPRWSVHLNFILSTDTVDGDGLPVTEDPQNSFGTVVIEWRP